MFPLLLVELIQVKQTHQKEDLKFNNQGKGIILLLLERICIGLAWCPIILSLSIKYLK